jgi:hypothetical protein
MSLLWIYKCIKLNGKNKMDIIAIIIDWILRITGIFSILVGILILLIPKKEFETNIEIRRVKNDQEDNFPKILYFDDPEIHNEHLLIKPINYNLKVVRIYSISFQKNKFKKLKLLKTFKNVNPDKIIHYNTSFPCGAPSRMIEWIGDYGVRGKYILAENGLNGDVDLLRYCYRYGFITNLRKQLALK